MLQVLSRHKTDFELVSDLKSVDFDSELYLTTPLKDYSLVLLHNWMN